MSTARITVMAVAAAAIVATFGATEGIPIFDITDQGQAVVDWSNPSLVRQTLDEGKRSHFFALRGRRASFNDHLLRGKKSQMNHLLRGRRSQMNHLLRGKKAQMDHLLRGKKSSMDHLLRGKKAALEEEQAKKSSLDHLLRGKKAVGNVNHFLRGRREFYDMPSMSRAMRGNFDHLMRGKKSVSSEPLNDLELEQEGDPDQQRAPLEDEEAASDADNVDMEQEQSYIFY